MIRHLLEMSLAICLIPLIFMRVSVMRHHLTKNSPSRGLYLRLDLAGWLLLELMLWSTHNVFSIPALLVFCVFAITSMLGDVDWFMGAHHIGDRDRRLKPR